MVVLLSHFSILVHRWINLDKEACTRWTISSKGRGRLDPTKKLAPGVRYDGRVGPVENYRYRVNYPEDGKYTIEPLSVRKLGGRDPVTGRKIIQMVGGGSKQKFRWVDWKRLPDDWPRDKDYVERVLEICYDPMRSSKLALTCHQDKLRWQLALTEMQEGDLITTTGLIPDIPLKPQVGNSYPVGALPIGTQICLLQCFPGSDFPDIWFTKNHAVGQVLRRVGDRVIIEDKKKKQFSVDQKCQCVVGQVSIHPLKACEIGSPQRLRWLGIRPRSGLWHRKTGIHGRKVRPPPTLKTLDPPEKSLDQTIVLTCRTEGTQGRMRQRRKPFPIDQW